MLRCDSEPESLTFVKTWDNMTRKCRSVVGLDAIALEAGLKPRRLWELFNGAVMVQSRESVGTMIAMALPGVFRVTIKNAKKAKGYADREHLYKVSGSLPTPKGSTTNINVGQKPAELTEGDDTKGDLESMDDFAMRAGKVMAAKQLPAAPMAEAEIVDDEDEAE